MKTKDSLNIIAISGSLKATSANTAILKAITQFCPENVVVEIFEGLDLLPHFNPEISEDIPQVIHFRDKIKEADAVLFSTPEYAFGVPGVLKNALDWLVFSGELNEKPVAAISVSPIITGGDKALASLLLTLSALGTKTNENLKLSIGSIKSKINDSGAITDGETILSLEFLLNNLIASVA
jgi:chromate reductase